MTTLKQRRTYPVALAPHRGVARTDDPLPPCDEVLAARLAAGLHRLAWLGALAEHLLRRLARRPPATLTEGQDGA